MADKPIYYGGSKSAPMYYGSSRPMYSNQRSPMYYGADRNYGNAQYGAYGSQGAGTATTDDKSIVGTITLNRMLRVIGQRWLSIFVFLLIGIIVSFAIHSVSPRIYEAASEFAINIKSKTSNSKAAYAEEDMPELGNNYAEVFNTSLSKWRSPEVIKRAIDNYHKEYDKSSASDADLTAMLGQASIELVRNSRNIKLAVRSEEPETAMALANAYVQAIDATVSEEADKIVAKAKEEIENRLKETSAERDKLKKELLEFKVERKIETLKSECVILAQSLQKVTENIANLEAQKRQLIELVKNLEGVGAKPEEVVARANDILALIDSSAPGAAEVMSKFNEWGEVKAKYDSRAKYEKDTLPEMAALKAACLDAEKNFVNSINRAYVGGKKKLEGVENQLTSAYVEQEKLKKALATVSEKIAHVDSECTRRESDINILDEEYKEQLKIRDSISAQESRERRSLVINTRATQPTSPVLPNTMLIFGVGLALSLVLGVLFVLVLDNLEDTVVNLADIEGRLSLKVLAVLPHVRRKKREHVAKFTVEEKYSHFSEAVAGLRNLLDSPRYEAMVQSVLVISTQPGEGKTITSTSMAISYAQTGRKVLHVDFDLRRPRIAGIWGVELTEERSFSHVLQKAGAQIPDFASLVNKTPIEGLDIICSLPPTGVTPATIFGSSSVAAFFTWARANYDRIIIDSPPYGVVGDVVSLAVLVDSVIIMCCPDRTHFKPIQYCSRSLTEAGANILGVVVNDVDISNASAFNPGSASSHRYNYGYGYGYGYGGYGYSPKKKKTRRGDGDNPVDESNVIEVESTDAVTQPQEAQATAIAVEAQPSTPITASTESDDTADDD